MNNKYWYNYKDTVIAVQANDRKQARDAVRLFYNIPARTIDMVRITKEELTKKLLNCF